VAPHTSAGARVVNTVQNKYKCHKLPK